MCTGPRFIMNEATGMGRVVVCQKCWQCRDRRVSDWMGRCIAESRTVKASSYVTFTYGREDDSPDHLRASVLTYSDFQKWLKRIRKAGYPVRYLVVGEYGTLNGRTHWHAILFWPDGMPPVEYRKNVVQAMWGHGYSYWDDVRADTARYVCKYVLKDQQDELKQGHLSMSKVPPLGAEYFSGLALQLVKGGMAPRDKVYKFRDVVGADGLPKKFYLGGRSWELFCEAYVFWWGLLRPGQYWPWSQVLQDYLDTLEPAWIGVLGGRKTSPVARMEDGTSVEDFLEAEAIREAEARKRDEYPAYYPTLLGWMLPDRVQWSERHECAFYVSSEELFSMPLYWHDQGGEYRWQNVAPSDGWTRAQQYKRERPLMRRETA